MRILYISQYFPPEMGAPSARVFELSREWARLGHDVTVLTGFAHHPTGRKAHADHGVFSRRERVAGIDVVRAYVYAAPNKGTVRRMASYASFMLAATGVGMGRCPRPDVVIATSPQLLCGLAGWALARHFRAPFVFEVRDLWPESILAVGAMRENLVVRGLKRLVAFLYGSADQIVTVGRGYRRKIQELYGIPPAAMEVIPNGIDAAFFSPGDADDLRRARGWQGKTVVLYLGTHGMAHALDGVLAAARLLKEDPRIRFALVGEGAEKASLQALARDWELPNVEFIDQQPKAEVLRYYRACDIGLVTLRDTPLFQEVLPSKIFEYMGTARPILLTVGGDSRRVVEDARAGLYVSPENPQALADAIRKLAADPTARHRLGQAGRQCVVKEYDRHTQARAYLDLLTRTVAP